MFFLLVSFDSLVIHIIVARPTFLFYLFVLLSEMRPTYLPSTGDSNSQPTNECWSCSNKHYIAIVVSSGSDSCRCKKQADCCMKLYSAQLLKGKVIFFFFTSISFLIVSSGANFRDEWLGLNEKVEWFNNDSL